MVPPITIIRFILSLLRLYCHFYIESVMCPFFLFKNIVIIDSIYSTVTFQISGSLPRLSFKMTNDGFEELGWHD